MKNSLQLVSFVFGAILLTSCNQVNFNSFTKPTPPPEEVKITTQKVIENLKNQPAWLYPADECPADLIPSIEKETEYLSEGCVNDPLKCLNKCEKNDANACYSLALLLQDYQGIEQQYSEPLFLRACKLGIVSGCTNRAAAKLNLEAANADAVKCAVNTFEKTCDKDDPWGCTMFGFALAQGTGREKNFDLAIEALNKSCKYGDDDPACQQAKRLKEEIEKAKKQTQKK
jgi:hypothetical protein